MTQPRIDTTDTAHRAHRVQRVLKQNLNRTVSLEDWRESDRVVGRVVKRFHGARFGDGLLDRFRARREWRSLVALHAAGLPVPEPVEMRRRAGGWEVVSAFVDGAVTLRALIDGEQAWPCSPEKLVRPLARLLADTLGAGLEHSDLHAGNVLVDPGGDLWLVDLGRSRLRPTASPTRVESALVQLAAETRERVPCGLRLRTLRAFLAAAPAALRAGLRPVRELAGRIETEGRRVRRQGLVDDRSRWTRESRSVERLEVAGHTGWAARRSPRERWASLAGRLIDAQDGERIELAGGHSALVLREAGPNELRRRWTTAGLLSQHDLPCARPLWLVETPRAMGVFELPSGATPLVDHTPSVTIARGLGRLFGAVHDRGLVATIPAEAILWSPQHGAALGARVELAGAPQGAPPGARPTVCPAIGRWTAARELRAAFVEGFVAAQRGGERERARLAQEWSG